MAKAKTSAEKKPLPKGLKWKNLNYDDFNFTFPRIGVRRLTERVKAGDKSAEPKLAELKEYVWRYRRKRNYRYPGRYSPSKRKGAKFVADMVPIDVHAKLKELAKFYKKSMSQIFREQIEPFFDETYKQAELLARIEKNREKNSVSPYVDKPGG